MSIVSHPMFLGSVASQLVEIPTENLLAHYQPSGMSRHGLATIVGDAQISTAQSKFDNSSLLLDAVNDSIEHPASSDFEFTGDFTVELFIRLDALFPSRVGVINNRYPSATNYWEIDLDNIASTQQIRSIFNTASGFIIMTSSTNLAVDTWYHVVICRQASTIRMYLDGVQQDSDTLTGSFSSSDKLAIGPEAGDPNDFDGYMDEIRISNGICRYPDGATFTPTTEPFEQDEYTVYLNHFDGDDTSTRMFDSASPFSSRHGNATVNNTAQLDTAEKKYGSASLTMDGDDDYIQYANSTDWDLSSTDWTIQTWLKFNSAADIATEGHWICSTNQSATNDGWQFGYVQTGGGQLRVWDNSVGNRDVAWTPTVDVWYHVALVASGGTLKVYVGGVLQGTYGSLGDWNNNSRGLNIGSANNTGGTATFYGFFDDFSISHVAEYTTGFAPPTEALGIDQYTVLYLPFDGYDTSVIMPDFAQGTSAFGLWVDDSGNANDGVQATGSKQPLGSPNALNGLSGAEFDGTDDTMLCGANLDIDDMSIYIVYKSLASVGGTTERIICIDESGSVGEGYMVGNISDTLIYNAYQTGQAWNSSGAGSLTVSTFFLISATLDISGDAKTYLDGSIAETQSGGNGSAVTYNSPHNLWIASQQDTARYNNCQIMEIAIYDVTHSDATREQVESVLNAEYGL